MFALCIFSTQHLLFSSFRLLTWMCQSIIHLLFLSLPLWYAGLQGFPAEKLPVSAAACRNARSYTQGGDVCRSSCPSRSHQQGWFHILNWSWHNFMFLAFRITTAVQHHHSPCLECRGRARMINHYMLLLFIAIFNVCYTYQCHKGQFLLKRTNNYTAMFVERSFQRFFKIN